MGNGEMERPMFWDRELGVIWRRCGPMAGLVWSDGFDGVAVIWFLLSREAALGCPGSWAGFLMALALGGWSYSMMRRCVPRQRESERKGNCNL